MGFVVQPYLARGTATPCVARTVPQTSDLVNAFPLTEDHRKALIEVSHNVMLKLVACLDQAEPVITQVAEGKSVIARGQVRVNPAGNAVQLPAVVDLRNKAETFLYNVKAALREIAGVFMPLYGQAFDHKFQKIRQWAEVTFGPTDPLTQLLAADAAWIERVIKMRNAVDHPGSGDGTLYTENFKLVTPGPPIQVAEPRWWCDAEQPTAAAADMAIINEDLLALFEGLLCDGLLRLNRSGPLTIYEIPPPQRNPSIPIRFKVGLSVPLPTGEA